MYSRVRPLPSYSRTTTAASIPKKRSHSRSMRRETALSRSRIVASSPVSPLTVRSRNSGAGADAAAPALSGPPPRLLLRAAVRLALWLLATFGLRRGLGVRNLPFGGALGLPPLDLLGRSLHLPPPAPGRF